MAEVSVFVADEQRMMTEALAIALGRFPHLKVVGFHSGDGHAALQAVIRKAPDVVVYDYWMPGTGGPAAARYLASWAPRARVVLLSWLHGPTQVREALASGAAGLLRKSVTLGQLSEALRSVGAGGPLTHGERPPARRDPVPRLTSRRWDRLSTLSPRELEVLYLLCQGASLQELAQELRIAEGTVRNHIHTILSKTGASTKFEAINLARQEGLVRERGTPDGYESQ